MFLSLIVTLSIRSITVAAIGVAAFSLTAFAPPDTPKPAASAPAQLSSVAADADPNLKYCVKQRPTGTRMDRKVCKTKAGWAREGVDITKEEVIK